MGRPREVFCPKDTSVEELATAIGIKHNLPLPRSERVEPVQYGMNQLYGLVAGMADSFLTGGQAAVRMFPGRASLVDQAKRRIILYGDQDPGVFEFLCGCLKRYLLLDGYEVEVGCKFLTIPPEVDSKETYIFGVDYLLDPLSTV